MRTLALLTIAASSVAFVACTADTGTDTPPVPDVVSSSSSSSSSSRSSAAVSAISTASQAAQASSENRVRIVNITVDNWSFTPSTIRVKKGEKVQLVLTGKSGIHGFSAPGLGLNVTVEPGKTFTVDLNTLTA